MLNRFFILALSLYSLSASAAAWQEPTHCLAGQIKTKFAGQANFEPASYCTNEDGTELLSQSCKDKKNCQALSFKGTKDKAALHMTAQGTPGFHLCTELKGDAQVIELTLPTGSWVKLDRCLFNDGSFIDVGSLLEITYQ